jgi:hypothetical protein
LRIDAVGFEGDAVDSGKTAVKIRVATYNLTGVETDLRQPTLLFSKGTLTLAKAKVAYESFEKYLSKSSDIAKLVGDKDFEGLPDELKAEAVWLTGLLTQLNDKAKLFEKAMKIAKAGAEAKQDKILKHAKLCIVELRTPPKLLEKLAKRMLKGEAASPEQVPFIPFLPLAIIAWAIADMIELGVGKRPR